jgi:hypothetical protein
MYRITIILACFFAVLCYSGILAGQFSEEVTQRQTAMTNLSAGSLAFTENRGQWGEKTLFKAESGGATFYFCQDEVAYLFVRDTDELLEDDLGEEDFSPVPEETGMPGQRYKRESLLIKAQFLNANPDVVVAGEGLLNHKCNYFYGNDPSKWRSEVPSYSSITYKDIWPGIDLKYHGNGKGIKYDFIINPGANLSQIKIRYEGVEALSITNQGDLKAQTRFGLIYEDIPRIYQDIGGLQCEIAGRYAIIEPGVFGFVLDDGFDRALPLVIDPELVYSTYLGGDSTDCGQSIAIDGSGNAYVTGYTQSSNFPMVNPYDGGFNGDKDVFVTKLSPAGDSLIYSTYLGGDALDWGRCVVVDSNNCAYITGYTQSQNFPTQNPFDSTLGGDFDAFVCKLNAAGNGLVYSTYLGGSIRECEYGRHGMAVDRNQCAYIAGRTNSPDFPLLNPFDSVLVFADAFITKFSPDGNTLVYSSFLGGSHYDDSHWITVDDSGFAYVTGETWSDDFPIKNPFDGTLAGGEDAFVSKISIAGDSLIYSTYIGGDSLDEGQSIAVDMNGSVCITGRTASTNFPLHNPFDSTYGGQWDVFITKLSHLGNTLDYSTFLGGRYYDCGYGIAIDLSGCVYVTGETHSDDFPLRCPFQIDQGIDDAFVTKLSEIGDIMVYSTYLGGLQSDLGVGIAVDSFGCAYVTGHTTSNNFPTKNAFDFGYNGGNPYGDVYISKFRSCIACYDYLPGDANMYNGVWPPAVLGADVTYLINYFRAMETSQPCPLDGFWASADANGDCSVIGSDATRLINYLRGVGEIEYCPDYPPVWHLPKPEWNPSHPDYPDLESKPVGWPNCE